MGLRSRHGFWRRRGATSLTLHDEELRVLAGLAESMVELVGPAEPADADPLALLVGIDAEAETPVDPAVHRLLPDAYRDDDNAAADFRRFTERSLRQLKADRAAFCLQLVTDMSGQVDQDHGTATAPVSGEDAQALLGALNDMRLVLGSRLGIETDDQDITAGWSPDDPRLPHYDLYQWLTWLQSTLLDTLAR